MKAILKPHTAENVTILAVDIGTTGMKIGVFQVIDDALTSVRQFSQEYEVNIYNNGLFGDIEQEKWKKAFVAGCKAMGEVVGNIGIISFSGTTPGLTAMDKNGEALYPAILMLDQRSRKQARFIIETIGKKHLLKTTANMPVAGGCSLASILWIKDNHPDIFNRTHKFGHSNTYIAHWLTGTFAMDPSSASLTALYNTVANDLSWNEDIAATFGLRLDRLPEIVPAYKSVGRVNKSLAGQLGFKKEPAVLIGGNDAVSGVRQLQYSHSRATESMANIVRDERRRKGAGLVQRFVLQRIEHRTVLRPVPSIGD
jgi:xylulokinase